MVRVLTTGTLRPFPEPVLMLGGHDGLPAVPALRRWRQKIPGKLAGQTGPIELIWLQLRD